MSEKPVVQALVVSPVIVMADEPADRALGLGMVGCTANMIYALVIEPFGQITRDVTGAIIRQ